jgi:hypothetical protein
MYTVYDRIYGNFLAKNIVYAPYIYGSGQPYTGESKMKAEQPVPSFPPDTADKNSLTCQSKIQDGEDEVAPESKRETLNLEAD